MAHKVTIRKFGNAQGIILREELLRHLGANVDDELIVMNTPDGLRLSRFDPDVAPALKASRRFTQRFPDAMKKLAG